MRAGADERTVNGLQALQALDPKLRVARRGAAEVQAWLQPIQSCSARAAGVRCAWHIALSRSPKYSQKYSCLFQGFLQGWAPLLAIRTDDLLVLSRVTEL